jgi:hypothetical protein
MASLTMSGVADVRVEVDVVVVVVVVVEADVVAS